MKKVYVEPTIKVTMFQIEDITCSTPGVTSSFRQGSDTEGLGANNTKNNVIGNGFFTA